MKNSFSRVVNLALCIGVTILLFTCVTNGTSAQKPRCVSEAPVTTTIEGTYRIQSDLLGSYQNGVDSVQSVLQACSGDWVLDTSSSPTRKVFVDFRDPVPNSGATPPFLFNQVPARLIAKAHDTISTSVLGMHGLNSTLLSPLSVAFDYGGSSYGVRMNPNNWPQTNYALVTCTGVVDPANPATSQCNQWRIEPSVTQPDGERKNIAHLERLPKGRPVSENHGDFYMSFTISMTNP
jgi:hypothetical protein